MFVKQNFVTNCQGDINVQKTPLKSNDQNNID